MPEFGETLHGRVIAVERKPLGGELNGNHGIGVTTLNLFDAIDFEETGGLAVIKDADGNDEELTYTAADDEANTITINPGLVAAWDDEDFVYVYPYVFEWRAQILVDDASSEPLYARIPSRWVDVLPEGIRETGVTNEEAVSIAWDGSEWVLTDIISKEPRADAAFIDPTTFTEAPPSDGTPPAASPDADVQGGISWISVRWDAITNVDPVMYEVYVKTTDPGTTPSAADLYAEVTGTSVAVRTLPDGTPLVYGQDYFVRIRARDEDGQAASAGVVGSAQLVQVNSPDIAVNAIIAEHILAGEITADKLAAVLILASLIKTAEFGQRVEIDTDGIRLYNPMGDVIVEIPTDPNKAATFKGEIIASGLDVLGTATFRGTTSFDQESVTELLSGVANPSTKPTVTVELEQIDPPDIAGTNPRVLGMVHVPDGGAGRTTDVFYVYTLADNPGKEPKILEIDSTTGAVLRSYLIPTTSSHATTATGLARVGDYLYYIHRNTTVGGTQQALIVEIDIATLDDTGDISGNQIGIFFTYACLGNDDAGNLVWVTRAGASGTQYRLYFFDPTNLGAGSSGNSTLTGGSGIGATSPPVGFYHDTALYWIATRFTSGSFDSVQAYNDTTLALTANRDWRTWPQGLNKIGAMTWDSTRDVFITVPVWNTADYHITIHTAWDWTTEDDLYWIAYTWYATGGADETLISPMQTIDLTGYRRARLKISHPDMPMVGGIDEHHHYVQRDNTAPVVAADLNYQSEPNFSSSEMDMPSYLINYDPSGAAPPTTNNFPGGDPAELFTSANPVTKPWTVKGDGFFHPAHVTTSQLPASPTKGQTYYDVDADCMVFWNGKFWQPMHLRHGEQLGIFSELSCDFEGLHPSSADFGGGVVGLASGTGAAVANVDTTTMVGSPVGVARLDTGTTAAGWASVTTKHYQVWTNTSELDIVYYSALIYIDVLGTDTQALAVGAGISSAVEIVASQGSNNGWGFRYRHDVSSGKFQCNTYDADGAVTTHFESESAVAADTWYLLECLYDRPAATLKWWINDTLVGTLSSITPGTTADFPSATSMRPYVTIEKTVGTTERTLHVDAMTAFWRRAAKRY